MLKAKAVEGGYLGVKPSLGTRIGQSSIWQSLSACIIGFLMARSVAFGDFAPFGVSAVAVYPKKQGAFALLGVILGYLLPGAGSNSLKYTAAAIAVYALRWLLDGSKKLTSHIAYAPITSALCIGVIGIVIVVSNGFIVNDVLMCFAETLLCAGVAFFLQKALPFVRNPGIAVGVSQQELASIIITFGIMATSLAKIEFDHFSPGRVLVILFILFAGRYGKEAAGSIAGIAAGVAISISSRDLNNLPAGYAFGGLMAGVFSPLGRIGSASAFILANGITAIYFGGSAYVLITLYEVMAATVIFMLIPESFGQRITMFLSAGSGQVEAKGLREAVVSRLSNAGSALTEVSESINMVSERLAKVNRGDISAIYTKAADKVCSKCGLNLFCWENSYNETMGTFNDLTKTIKTKGRISKDDIAPYFASKCCKLPELIHDINHNYAEFAAREGSEERIGEIRGLIADQFDGISQMFNELSKDYEESERIDTEIGKGVTAILTAEGLEVDGAWCRVDRFGHMSIEAIVTSTEVSRVNKKHILAEIKRICGREFVGPEATNLSDGCHLKFNERAYLTADFAEITIACEGNKLAGDTSECFIDSYGRAVAIISDGMGSGGRAAVDSTMAVSLLSKLIKSGFGYDCALKIVNSALLVKSGDESLATVDLVSVDLFSGRAEFLKAGAPSTYVKRKGFVEPVGFSSMPAGILRGIEFGRSVLNIDADDYIVMVSDGAAMGDDEWLENELEGWNDPNPKLLAEHIANRARAHRLDGHDDDITVVAVKLRKSA